MKNEATEMLGEERKGSELVLTDASVVDEDGRIAMGVADGATEVDEVREIGNVAFVVVDIWYYGRGEYH